MNVARLFMVWCLVVYLLHVRHEAIEVGHIGQTPAEV